MTSHETWKNIPGREAKECSYSLVTFFLSQLNTEGKFFYLLGPQETVFAVGYEGGATLMGVLFQVLGTQVTLLHYSTSCAAVLVTLLLYTCFSQYDHHYQKLAQDHDKQ